jgi:DNA-binding IclR family transcriptional regulator
MVRPLTDRVLHLLHNLAAVNPDNAKSLTELAQLTQEPPETIQNLLKEEESSGHVKSLRDDDKDLRYYLTGLGILRAASMLT